MISIILIEPKNSGNVGAIARSMKNFDFADLVLIDPKCNHLSQTARNRAKHANDILSKVKVKSFSFLKRFDHLIATTSALGTDYNISRSPIDPERLGNIISGKKGNIGIVFGREGSGLKNSEIEICDFVVTIPSSKDYSALNISHSVSIILYELSKRTDKKKVDSHIIFATKKEKDILMKNLNKTLNKMEFATKEKKETQRKVWKRMIGKSFLTKREAFALIGFFKKLIK